MDAQNDRLNFYPSLVLVQPRKTCPCLTERLLMGRKESNQTNKLNRRNKMVLLSTQNIYRTLVKSV